MRHPCHAILAALLGYACLGAGAQTLTGGFFASRGGNFVDVTFTCTGSPRCIGTYSAKVADEACVNPIALAGAVDISGIAVAQPGTFQGSINATDFVFDDLVGPGRVCSITPGSLRATSFPYTGTWDGRSGTLTVQITDEQGLPGVGAGTFTSTAAPVFGMTVTGTIDNASANVRAEVQFRPQDIGTTQSIFVFALAPAGVVRPLSAAGQEPARAKADALPAGCVLAQVNATGQLQQVTASDMKALTTNTLTAQGLAITVLNGIATVQIAGATFYVGYGATAAAMINGGVNRAVATAPGAVQCKPEKPQTGWWWATTEGGRGYSLEVSGNNMFFASYLYDASGRATWYAAIMPVSLDGSLFTGTLFNKSGGQALDAGWRAPGEAVTAGSIVLAFSDSTHGTLVWPGGAVAIERFNIVPNGVGALSQPGQPQSGWWWNPAEDGRGFYIEWQGSSAFLAAYMYDAAGNPVWYASQAPTPSLQAFAGTLAQYGSGQTLTGTYRAPTQLPDAGPITITFQGADSGIMTLPGGRTTAISRFRF